MRQPSLLSCLFTPFISPSSLVPPRLRFSGVSICASPAPTPNPRAPLPYRSCTALPVRQHALCLGAWRAHAVCCAALTWRAGSGAGAAADRSWRADLHRLRRRRPLSPVPPPASRGSLRSSSLLALLPACHAARPPPPTGGAISATDLAVDVDDVAAASLTLVADATVPERCARRAKTSIVSSRCEGAGVVGQSCRSSISSAAGALPARSRQRRASAQRRAASARSWRGGGEERRRGQTRPARHL